MIRFIPFAALLAAGALAGCVEESPCDRYVDYICDCHPEDPDFDCAEARETYAGADASLEDECQIALDDQKAEDEEAGRACGEGNDPDTGV
jgi:outer membrane murein-binding lipoprotein Lpp